MVGVSETSPVCLVDLVCFVYLVHLVYPVSLVQPNKQDKLNKPIKRDRPNEQDSLAAFLTSCALIDRLTVALSDLAHD